MEVSGQLHASAALQLGEWVEPKVGLESVVNTNIPKTNPDFMVIHVVYQSMYQHFKRKKYIFK
jgi:hypothetical protein